MIAQSSAVVSLSVADAAGDSNWLHYGPLSKVRSDDAVRLRRPYRTSYKLDYQRYGRRRDHHHHHHRGFQPTDLRCCHVGSKMARKGVPCRVSTLDLPPDRRPFEDLRTPYAGRMSTMQRKDLSNRLGRCARSPFARHLRKCCYYGRAREKRLRECRRMRSAKRKRKCRKTARLTYP